MPDGSAEAVLSMKENHSSPHTSNLLAFLSHLLPAERAQGPPRKPSRVRSFRGSGESELLGIFLYSHASLGILPKTFSWSLFSAIRRWPGTPFHMIRKCLRILKSAEDKEICHPLLQPFKSAPPGFLSAFLFKADEGRACASPHLGHGFQR